jgi:hypothetical protein
MSGTEAGLGWHAWATVVVVVFMVYLLVRDTVAPAMAVFGATVALLIIGVIDVPAAVAGFANPAPMTVAALFVVARAVEKTGALQPLINATLGNGGSSQRVLGRLLVPTAGASAVLNNTPIVAMLAPAAPGARVPNPPHSGPRRAPPPPPAAPPGGAPAGGSLPLMRSPPMPAGPTPPCPPAPSSHALRLPVTVPPRMVANEIGMR